MPRPRVGKKIDFKSWNAIPGLRTEVSTVATFTGGRLTFAIPATILRVRGAVSLQFDETVQAGDVGAAVFGLAVVSEDAAVAEAVPDPGQEPEFPWLWWSTIELEAIVAGSNWTAFPLGPTADILRVDSKAMRKVKPGESLIWICQITVATGAPVMILKFHPTRVLIGT